MRDGSEHFLVSNVSIENNTPSLMQISCVGLHRKQLSVRQSWTNEDGGHFVGIFHADFARLHTLPTASTMKMAAHEHRLSNILPHIPNSFRREIFNLACQAHRHRSTKPPRVFTVASRASQLAQIQTNIVVDALRAAFPALEFTTSFMSTEGDKNQSQALYLLGGKALWTKELEGRAQGERGGHARAQSQGRADNAARWMRVGGDP